MIEDILVSRLPDGTLLWLREDGPFVFKNGAWIPSEGVTFGMATDSKPLTEAEIADLSSKGLLKK